MRSSVATCRRYGVHPASRNIRGALVVRVVDRLSQINQLEPGSTVSGSLRIEYVLPHRNIANPIVRKHVVHTVP